MKVDANSENYLISKNCDFLATVKVAALCINQSEQDRMEIERIGPGHVRVFLLFVSVRTCGTIARQTGACHCILSTLFNTGVKSVLYDLRKTKNSYSQNVNLKWIFW